MFKGVDLSFALIDYEQQNSTKRYRTICFRWLKTWKVGCSAVKGATEGTQDAIDSTWKRYRAPPSPHTPIYVIISLSFL